MPSYADTLIDMLFDARARTLELVGDLSDQQLIGPRLSIVNPLLWEIGHVAWFQERWVLRRSNAADSVLSNADALYDSARVPHDDRWNLALPPRQSTLEYMQRVLDQVVARASSVARGEQDDYFLQLVLFHEDMHDEAFMHMRQTLGFPTPLGGRSCRLADDAEPPAGPWPGDATVPGGVFTLGSRPDDGFIFDNEKWAHEVRVRPFQIARAAVTNAEFAEFVEDQGYARPEFWSPAGWAWRERFQVKQPVYWQRRDGNWFMRRYRGPVALGPHLPVVHVNWFEADAYCRWAARRLPTEAEWELAAAGEPAALGSPSASNKRRFPWGSDRATLQIANLDAARPDCLPVNALPASDSAFGCRQMIGNVWEWTASDFEPYPGFSPDPYREYSEPWFGGTHKVLRGGAFATRSRMISNNYRNYYTPDRRDVFAGFRTCGLE